jgi:hypothetical protein
VRGVARPGRVQDPHHFDVAYQGTEGYRPQPLVGVSNSHVSTTELLTNDTRPIEPGIWMDSPT